MPLALPVNQATKTSCCLNGAKGRYLSSWLVPYLADALGASFEFYKKNSSAWLLIKKHSRYKLRKKVASFANEHAPNEEPRDALIWFRNNISSRCHPNRKLGLLAIVCPKTFEPTRTISCDATDETYSETWDSRNFEKISLGVFVCGHQPKTKELLALLLMLLLFLFFLLFSIWFISSLKGI